MKRDEILLSWGYAVEGVLVAVAYGVMVLAIGDEKLLTVMSDHWPVFSTIAGVLFAAGVAVILYLGQMLDSEFGKYLNWRRADSHYLRGFQIQTVLFLIAGGVPIIATLQSNAWVTHLAWCVFLYACINGVTVVRNTVELVRLRQKFRSEHDSIVAQMDRERSAK